MEWLEYTPATHYLGDWNEEIYSQGGKNQYQQQHRFDANELGGLPSLPENESQNDITVLNNSSHNTPVFTSLKICNRQPPSYKDSRPTVYSSCVVQEQSIPDCDRVMMSLANPVDSNSVKDEDVENAVIGEMLQQCDDQNDNSQVLNLKTESSTESMAKSELSDASYISKGQDEMQRSKMAAIGVHYSPERYSAGVPHVDDGYVSKAPTILPSYSYSSTPPFPMKPSSHDGASSLKLYPVQSHSNEQRVNQDGSEQSAGSNNHVSEMSQPNNAQVSVYTKNQAGFLPPKNCNQNTYNAVQNTGYFVNRLDYFRIFKVDDVNPYPCEQPFLESFPHQTTPFDQGFNAGYQQQFTAGDDLSNINYHTMPSKCLPYHPPALASDHQTGLASEVSGLQCIPNAVNFPTTGILTSAERQFGNHPKSCNDLTKYEIGSSATNGCPTYSPQATPPSYAASQAARVSHGQQSLYIEHSSIFRSQMPAGTIGPWPQNETYKIPPPAINRQGSFSERGLTYRTFTKIGAPDWRNGLGASPQDFTPRTSAVCGFGIGNTLSIPSHGSRMTTETVQTPFEIRELAEDDISAKKSGRQKKTNRNRKFKCTYPNCTKGYCKQAQLDTHLRKHAGERPYRCEWEGCESCFQRSDQLKRHQRRHTGERPYRCILCEKCFARSDHLKTHTKTHEEKPHFCQWINCKKKFAHFEELSRHYQTHKQKERTHLQPTEV